MAPAFYTIFSMRLILHDMISPSLSQALAKLGSGEK